VDFIEEDRTAALGINLLRKEQMNWKNIAKDI